MAFLQDTFTGTDATAINAHTGETGATWSIRSGTITDFVITTNRLRPAATNYTLVASNGTPPSADYEVTAVVRCVSNNGFLQICGRLTTGGAINMYQATLDSAGGSGAGLYLYKTVSSVDTQLGSADLFTPSAGVDYVIKLVMSGSNIKVYRDGVLKISATDGAVTATGVGGIGGATYAAAGTGVGFHVDTITGSVTATFEQEGYRFRNDDGSETTATWKAAQDTDITDTGASNVRLRVINNVTEIPISPLSFRYEYRKGSGNWKPLVNP